ncbi:isochorismatase family protein [Pseudomonas asiatica]|nr:isochorismatase family protein [Pseudomonas asiatica]WJN52517.1 isochorismatase family protein [Pseudomonas asiatica]
MDCTKELHACHSKGCRQAEVGVDTLTRNMRFWCISQNVWKGVEPDLHPYGACYHDLAERRSTGVIEYLKVQQVGAVIVGGLALDYCVRTTARQLRQAGFQVLLYLPACRALTQAGAIEACGALAADGVILCGDEAALDHQLSLIKEDRP